MEIKNLQKAAKRILKAIAKKERIILYGDADLDGVTSVIILKETIKNLAPTDSFFCEVYFPDREKDGYGINKKGLEYLKKNAPALLIALDLGITNFKEVRIAKQMGFEVVIIDHHEVLEKIPSASIVVDPKQKNDQYPFKDLSNAGLTFKLAQLILGNKLSPNLRKNFLELVALATLADMMPLVEENKIMVEEGLESLQNTFRPGLQAFLEKLNNQGYSAREIASKIIASLNAAERRDHLNDTYLLLTCPDIKEAELLVKELLEKAERKRIKIQEIVEEIKKIISEKADSPLIFEASSSWPQLLLGSIASRICHLYKKPTFLFKKEEKESTGAVRVPEGVNSIELMTKCKKYLLSYGGHPSAAGCRLKNENLEKFRKCLLEEL